MRWLVRLGAAVAVVAASMAPGTAAQASVRTPGVTVGPTTYSTSSPSCQYSLDTSPSTNGSETTALHVRGTWSCPGVNADAYGSIDLEDMTMSPSGTVSTWPVASASDSSLGGSGAVSVDYTQPKTRHVYQATFLLHFGSFDPKWKSESGCSANGGSAQNYVCEFQQQYLVQLGPPIGAPAASAPVHDSVALTTTDGHFCNLDLDLALAGPGTLSYDGSVPPADCNLLGPPSAPPQVGMIAWAQTFAYDDPREPVPTASNGNFQCWYCSNTSSSSSELPAIANYTVTYYVGIDLGDLMLTSVPPQCTTGELHLLYCELTASVKRA